MKSRILVAMVILLVITACKGTFQIGLESTPSSPTSLVPLPTETSIPPSLTPQVPLATVTPNPPSPTPQPTATKMPAPANIIMAPGTTAAVVQGTIRPGQVVTYTLEAGQFQPMILLMDSPNNDVVLGVSGMDGNVLLNPAKKWTRWQGLLLKTATYSIQVLGGATSENFTLTAKVAKVVNFASGATSITLNGKTTNGYVFTYSLSCSANQTMTVSLNVPSSIAYIDIFGLASGALLSSSAKANTWTGILPQTQDYIIEVIPNNGQVVNYSLTVSVH